MRDDRCIARRRRNSLTRTPTSSADGRKRILYRLVVARSDIAETLRYLDLAEHMQPPQASELYFALNTAIVVSYARPFSNNELGPLRGQWAKFGNETLDTAHRELVVMRNKIVAHSDPDVRQVWIYTPGARLDDGSITQGYGVNVGLYSLNVSSYTVVRQLSTSLFERLDAKINAEVPRLFPHYVPVPFPLRR